MVTSDGIGGKRGCTNLNPERVECDFKGTFNPFGAAHGMARFP